MHRKRKKIPEANKSITLVNGRLLRTFFQLAVFFFGNFTVNSLYDSMTSYLKVRERV